MKLHDIEKIDSEWLTPAQVAKYIKCDPNTIRAAARTRPELLGFPITIMGSRIKIPKQAFIKYCMGESTSEKEQSI